MPLKAIVLQIIDCVGGKRESVYGLKVATQCFRYELLELIRPDGTKMQFSKTDCEHPTVCAAPVNPAEAVWVEPREDGPHFVRRPAVLPAPPAEPPQSPATVAVAADRQLSAAGESEPGKPPVEQLTYAQLAGLSGCSPEAARHRVARRHLPRTRGSDGKTRVAVSPQELLQQPPSARPPGGDHPANAR